MTDHSQPLRPLKVGYLTNVYPAVSHSFIKREILALENQGIAVHRWSIRPGATDLPDPEDRMEAGKTHVLLARPAALLLAAMRTAAVKPVRTWSAFRTSLEGRPAGLRSVIGRIGHLVEACYVAEQSRKAGLDHLHVHFGTNPASVARLAYALGGVPYSFTVHGPDEFDQPIAYCLSGKIADSRFAVAISAYGRSQLMRWSRLDDWNKIEVVRCGLDASFLDEPKPKPEQASDGIPVFSCVARLAPQKGLPILIEAAHLLKQAGKRFLIRIAGDGELRTHLEAEIRRYGLGEHFDLMGWASSAQVREVIRDSRAFVLPSFAEGLPVAIMEALAICCPVIVTRIAGIPELVDRECGWVVDAGSARQLADAMLEAIDASADQTARMGLIGRQRVLKAHNAEHNAAELAQLIRQSAEVGVS